MKSILIAALIIGAAAAALVVYMRSELEASDPDLLENPGY